MTDANKAVRDAIVASEYEDDKNGNPCISFETQEQRDAYKNYILHKSKEFLTTPAANTGDDYVMIPVEYEGRAICCVEYFNEDEAVNDEPFHIEVAKLLEEGKAALAPRQVDVEGLDEALKLWDDQIEPMGAKGTYEWTLRYEEFRVKYGKTNIDIIVEAARTCQRGLIGNADHFVQSPNMVEKIQGLEEAIADVQSDHDESPPFNARDRLTSRPGIR